MKCFVRLLGSLFVLTSGFCPLAAAPVNDNFADRITLTGFDITFNASNVDATRESTDPSYVNRGRSVWWSWTAPSDGQVTIDLCGSSFDTLLAVYTANPVSSSSPAVVLNDDDPTGQCGLDSRVSFTAVRGTTYQIAVDDLGGGGGQIVFHLVAPIPGRNVTIVPRGAIWKYLDDGTDLGAIWREPRFVDSGWASGPAQLGYGDGDEATVVGFGPDAQNKYVTTYYRHTFDVDYAAGVNNLTVRLLRDDGGVVYLNGTEIFRSNMPGGDILYNSFAASDVSGDENSYYENSVPSGLLVDGPNVLAVEIHQSALTSPDSSFDLELINFDASPFVSITNPTPGQPFRFPTNILIQADAMDLDGFITNVMFFVDGAPVTNVTEPPYNYEWMQPALGSHALRVQATDNTGNTTVSDVVTVSIVNNIPPVVSILSPPNNSTFRTPGEIPFEVSAVDYDGSLVRVQLFQGLTRLAEWTEPPFTYTWTNPPLGSYRVTARATDNEGRSVSSSQVQIEVTLPIPDDFDERGRLTGASVNLTGNNTGATREEGEPIHGYEGFNSLWYGWTAPANGSAYVNATASSAGNFTILVAVYTGSTVTTLTPVGNSAVGSSVSFPVTAGVEYQIAVDGYQGSQGEFTLTAAMATPPSNDNFANATVLAPNTVNFTGSNLGATREAGEPSHGISTGGPSVWWSWTAPVNSGVRLYLSGNNFFNGTFAVYTGASVGNLTQVAASSGFSGSVSFTAQAGVTYAFAVDGVNGSSGPISVGLEYYTPPPNDNFADSIPISGNGVTVTGNSVGATAEPGEPLHGGYTGGVSVWWSWTASSTGPTVISLDGSGLFNVLLGVYTGGSVSSLSTVASSAFQNQLGFVASAGTTYHIAVDQYFGSGGDIVLNVSVANVRVPTGSVWKYLDNGSDQGTAWRETGFDDSGWASGAAELGYGDGDEVTVVGFGPNPGNKYITTYFRHSFSLNNISTITGSSIRFKRDDGAAIYLNGIEVFRNNLPGGDITFVTLANGTVGGSDENAYISFSFNPFMLVDGQNVIAVEMHQAEIDSSDLSFDLELSVVGGNTPPSVTITSPVNNANYPSGTTSLPIIVEATATDATVTKVEFFRDGFKLGEDTDTSDSTYTFQWNNIQDGVYLITAVATDSRGTIGSSAAVIVSVGILPPLIPVGSVWNYLDNGSNQGTAWRELDFDDSGWASGPAELGYGDGDEATVVSYGPSFNNKYITTYFRRTFDVPDPLAYTNLAVRLNRDDGGVVYLNGVEVFRSSMPNGPVNYQTRAQNSEGGPFFQGSVNPFLLQEGPNVVAVEIHQTQPDSSDISFDLELFGNSSAIFNTAPTVTLTQPVPGGIYFATENITLAADASDPDGAVGRVEFFADGNLIGEAASQPFSFVWNNVPAGNYQITAAAIDNQGARVLSSPVSLVVNESTPSVNDDFADRIVLTDLGTYEGSNLTATKEPGEPDHADNAGGRSVWWSWTAVTNGPVTITTGGSSFDTLLAVYTGSAVDNLTLVVGNDEDPLASVTSRVILDAIGGTTYQIAVDGANGAFGLIALNLGNRPPEITGINPPPGAVAGLDQITVTFSKAVVGVDAADLWINGQPAVSVTGNGAVHTFHFPPPAYGPVVVFWKDPHGIVDLSVPPNPFDAFVPGASWSYVVQDILVPTLARISPAPGATVPDLEEIEITFTEPVLGLNASDVLVNGVPAAGLSGSGAGPYRIGFAAVAGDEAHITWRIDHGIRDLASPANAFTASGWSYLIETQAADAVVINEIMYHPASERADEEWVELHNTGASDVRVAGWEFSRGVNFILPDVTIPAGGYLVVAADVAAFSAKYPSVNNVVGGWEGRLSNAQEDVELEDPLGNRVDIVHYADEGDFALRVNLNNGQGWEWTSQADGFGRSLELRNAALSNNPGHNWLASVENEGTPGRANSVASTDIPPMIADVTHFPVVPRSTDNVTVTARIIDELTAGLTVQLWYRNATTTALPAFSNALMADDGASNDGAAGDGIYGTVLPAMANGTILEYYVEALDQGAQRRTWPAEVDNGGFGNLVQEANAFLQVNDEVYTGSQPYYQLIMRPTDRNSLINQSDRFQRNATFITVEGDDVQLRHNSGIRRRGASSFGASPPTMKLNIPADRPWNDKTSMNLNSVNTWAHVLGNSVALKAGLAAGHARGVQLRFNGLNLSRSDSQMYGSYVQVEVVNGEWAEDFFPSDGGGNVYSKRRPECGLEYQGPNPQSYINCAYDKESNASENDWTDLINLTFALDPDTTSNADYVQAVRANLNVEQWMRYFAVLFLMNYNETALATGEDDDYNMYRGIEDPRFIVVGHDFDSVFGSSGTSPNNIFLPANIPNMSRFIFHPEFQPEFYAEYRRQLAGAFSTNNLFPLMDQLLTGWVPGVNIQNMKAIALNRINFVRNQLPPEPTVVRATISGQPDSPTFLDSATLQVGGAGISQYRHRVNGGAWSEILPVADPITLTGLPDGAYVVSVVGGNAEGAWQPEAEATLSPVWIVNGSLRGVVLNEILARNNSAFEHAGGFPDLVELHNAGSQEVDLGGLSLTDDLGEPAKFVFPAGTMLAGGEYLILFADFPDGSDGFHLGFSLAQEGETIYLLDNPANDHRVLDRVEFGLQLVDRSIGLLANGQWSLCLPTLGSANTAAPTGSRESLVLNEWLANPAAPFVDDFIEVYNPTPLPVSLGGLYLTDNPIGAPYQHRIASLSYLAAYSYQAFLADGNASAGANHVNFQLAKEVGEIGLLEADGTVLDCVTYGPQVLGQSQGRSPNGSSIIASFELPTPGAGNPSKVGPPPPTLVPLIALDEDFLWRYEDTGTDLGTEWKMPEYDADHWPEGAALLAFESGGLPAPIRTTLNLQNGKYTYYFRAPFYVDPDLEFSGLQLTHVIDDGAVFYINGVEVSRFRMPAGDIFFSTLANNGPDATYQGPFDLPSGSLQEGWNTMAVEVHQSSFSSTDVVFGMRLDAVIMTNNPALAGLQLSELMANNQSVTNADGSITDWVEIHNPSGASVNLSGMSLTDDPTFPQRWVFPEGSSIAAEAYLLLRCDPDSPASTAGSADLNTGFGLKASGDAVYLFNVASGGGELLDAVTFGVQAEDWSIGRVPGGGTGWALTQPTPGFLNIAVTLGNPALLKVNEWMADPASGDDWFEIFNPNPQPVALGGLHLTDNLNDRLKHQIAPLSFISIGLRGFLEIKADDNLPAGADHVNFKLSASGESIGIADAAGNLIDSLTFARQATGISEGRLPDGGTTTVAFPETGTPGNSNYLPLDNVVVNEVLTHSDPPVEDAIELHNLSASPVDLSGWYLSDSKSTPKNYRIPDGTIILAGDYVVFYEYQFNSNPGGPLSFSLSSAKGDDVYLSAADADGNLTGYRAGISFGPAENGVTFGRYQTSVGIDFVAMSQRTLGVDDPDSVEDFRMGTGLTNAYPLVGPVVIHEIMYHPPEVDGLDNVLDEYIELRNITAFTIPLHDPAFPANTWRLDDAVTFDFPANLSLPPGGYLIVVSFDPADDPDVLNDFRTRNRVPATTPIVGPYKGKLDNSSESVELYKPDAPQPPGSPDEGLVPYILVEQVKYADLPPWPTAADGGGFSLQRVDEAAYGNDPVNWIAAAATPGFEPQDNSPPMITPQPPVVIEETRLLSFTMQATDTNVPAQSLVFSLDPGAPQYATITSDGQFTWRPRESHGPGDYDIAIRVTDNGTPNLSDMAVVRVTVAERNFPPRFIDTIQHKYVNAGRLLTFATAADMDLPQQTLSFTLEPGLPTEAVIDPLTGVFSWRPTEDQGPADYNATVRVTDDGSPNLSSAFTYVIHVRASTDTFIQIGFAALDNGLLLKWNTTPGKTYRVEYTDSLDAPSWQPLGSDITADDEEASITDEPPGQRFYRVLQLD